MNVVLADFVKTIVIGSPYEDDGAILLSRMVRPGSWNLVTYTWRRSKPTRSSMRHALVLVELQSRKLHRHRYFDP